MMTAIVMASSTSVLCSANLGRCMMTMPRPQLVSCIFIVLTFIGVLTIAPVRASGSTKDEARKLTNVFIIPHSHCDPGWRITFQQYYEHQVRHILTNTVQSLRERSDRTFVWSEISFFSKWWSEQPVSVKSEVRKWVGEGRWEFVGGGWVMHDESLTHIVSAIDQIALGHEFLYQHFDVRPTVAWQLDPFGHSSLSPSLFSAMGYDNIVLNRLHYATKSTFRWSKHLEFFWQAHGDQMASKSGQLQSRHNATLFAHVLFDHYTSPDGFDWEFGGGYPVDPEWIERAASKLVGLLKIQAASYEFGDDALMLLWGDDFRFVYAQNQFRSMDILMSFINAHSSRYGMKLEYSTPSKYFDRIKSLALARDNHREGTGSQPPFEWPLYIGDFLPYANNEDCYWTGFYSTRPALKSHVRATESILASAQAALSALLFELNHEHKRPTLDSTFLAEVDTHIQLLQTARESVALLQHHDGITGTCAPEVVRDYNEHLDVADEKSRRVLEWAISSFSQRQQLQPSPTDGGDHLPPWKLYGSKASIFSCEEESDRAEVSPVLQMTNTDGTPRTYDLAVFNPLPHNNRTTIMCIRVSHPNAAVIMQSPEEGISMPRQQISPRVKEVPLEGQMGREITISETEFEVMFVANTSSWGTDLFTLVVLPQEETKLHALGLSSALVKERRGVGKVIVVNSGSGLPTSLRTTQPSDLEAEISTIGLLNSISSGTKQPQTTSVHQSLHVYRDGETRSGAYLFRPRNHAEPVVADSSTSIHSIGSIVSSIRTLRNIRVSKLRSKTKPGDNRDPSKDDYPFQLLPLDTTTRVFVAGTELSDTLQQTIRSRAALGDELISRFELKDNKHNGEEQLWTDINGFGADIQRRRVENKWPMSLVWGRTSPERNYHAASTHVSLRSPHSSIATAPTIIAPTLNVAGDSPFGAGHILPGSVEVMLHRHLPFDDEKGLRHPLLDSSAAIQHLWLRISATTNASMLTEKPHPYDLMRHPARLLYRERPLGDVAMQANMQSQLGKLFSTEDVSSSLRVVSIQPCPRRIQLTNTSLPEILVRIALHNDSALPKLLPQLATKPLWSALSCVPDGIQSESPTTTSNDMGRSTQPSFFSAKHWVDSSFHALFALLIS